MGEEEGRRGGKYLISPKHDITLLAFGLVPYLKQLLRPRISQLWFRGRTGRPG